MKHRTVETLDHRTVGDVIAKVLVVPYLVLVVATVVAAVVGNQALFHAGIVGVPVLALVIVFLKLTGIGPSVEPRRTKRLMDRTPRPRL